MYVDTVIPYKYHFTFAHFKLNVDGSAYVCIIDQPFMSTLLFSCHFTFQQKLHENYICL